MKKIPFRYINRLVAVECLIKGTNYETRLTMAIDTGSVFSTISSNVLDFIGFDTIDSKPYQVITASGEIQSQLVAVPSITIFGAIHPRFTVLKHLLPDNIQIDGLLGLDFFKQKKLELDFRDNTITISI